MSDVTRLLERIESGDPSAAGRLFPLVYDELRRLASSHLVREKPGHTLQATALVHEAFVRLVDTDRAPDWANRRHFFAAASEAMRRILVESARRKRSLKRGGGRARVDLDESLAVGRDDGHDLLELDELIDQLAAVDASAAELVKLRFFAGLTGDEVAAVLGVSPRSADLLWAYARAWLFEKMQRGAGLTRAATFDCATSPPISHRESGMLS